MLIGTGAPGRGVHSRGRDNQQELGNKTGADPTYLDNIKSGHVADNTHHRNLNIANPQNAKGSFTVEVSI